jgi:hypothetical protein
VYSTRRAATRLKREFFSEIEDIASMIEDPEHALAEFECMAGELTNGAAQMIVDAIIESGKMRLFHIANVDDWDQHVLFCGCESRVTDFWMYG